MATRVTAVRLLGLLLGVAVLAGLVLLARPATAPRSPPTATGAVPGARRPSATVGGPAAMTPGPRASSAAGTTPTAPAAGPTSDPCRLVTRAEAAAALGQPIAKVRPRQGFLVRLCLFVSAPGGRQLIVQLYQGPAASLAQFRMARRPDDQPVAGVGDEAWFTPDTCLLDVRQGAARFQVGLLDATGRPGPRRVPPSLVTLARTIAGRL